MSSSKRDISLAVYIYWSSRYTRFIRFYIYIRVAPQWESARETMNETIFVFIKRSATFINGTVKRIPKPLCKRAQKRSSRFMTRRERERNAVPRDMPPGVEKCAWYSTSYTKITRIFRNFADLWTYARSIPRKWIEYICVFGERLFLLPK